MSDQDLRLARSTTLSDRLRAWFIGRAGASLTSNGYALIASSLITSALGMLFWAVAARSFTQAEVGIGAALIAALTPLASAAQFNFKNVIYRFVASPGPRAQQMVLRLYFVSAAAAVVLGSGFAMLVPWIDPDLTELVHAPWVAAAFVVAVVIWTIYGLQEAALVALRLSTLMPLKSLIYAVAKILALFGLASFAASGLNILAAWVVPALAIGLATSAMLARYAEGAQDPPGASQFSSRQLAGFLGWDYVGSLASSLSYGMAPMLVIAAAGTVAGAHFYLAFSIAYVLYLVGSQMGAALMAEHASQRRHPRALYADALVQTLVPVTAVALAILIVAPYIMQVFGPDFVDPGSNVLRLLVLSAIPGSAITIYLAICRAKSRVRLVAAVQLLNLGLSLGLGYVLSGTLGEIGMGLALLLTQTAIAASLTLWTLRERNVLVGTAVDFGSAMLRLSDKLSSMLRRLRPRPQARTEMVVAGERWTVVSEHQSLSDAQTLMLRRPEAKAACKSARSPLGILSIAREHSQLLALHEDERLLPFRDLLPAVLAFSQDEAEASLLLDRLGGQDGRSLTLADDAMNSALQAATDCIGAIHRATATAKIADQDWISVWIRQPMTLFAGERLSGGSLDAVGAIAQELTAFFSERALISGRGHGDFCLDNILFALPPHGLAVRPSGIVDWSESRSNSPAGLDAVFLALTMRVRLQERELGHIVLDLLNRPHWTESEQIWLGWAERGPGETRAMVLLAWLNHVASNLRKSGRYGASRFWFWANVKIVVDGYERSIR